jgi:hypothetical protein
MPQHPRRPERPHPSTITQALVLLTALIDLFRHLT